MGKTSTEHISVRRTGAVLATQAMTAHSLLSRMVGLLGRAGLEPGQGLIIPHCRSIHTWGMRFPMDAVFVDRGWRVVALRQRLGPWRITGVIWRANRVLELPSGVIQQAGLATGDELLVRAT